MCMYIPGQGTFFFVMKWALLQLENLAPSGDTLLLDYYMQPEAWLIPVNLMEVVVLISEEWLILVIL